ncbi:MAG: hypothetical protein GYB33_06820 [Gammaproteobacteria bacterium]|nr:hypothetical protein [Gammaproteobacteria bacterium]
MPQAPVVLETSVGEVLAKFDAEFASVADAVANGEFALWVGSGISREAPNLGNLIERALDFIRVRAVSAKTAHVYLPALREALELADIDPAVVQGQYGRPLADWPQYGEIIKRLWGQYSRLLDIRIAGTDVDFILWEAIDIREAFRHPAPPAAEHLCIAILILEGAVNQIASANWDGFLEAAVQRLGNGIPGVIQVVVDPDHLRGPAGRARLLKFHGCILHAESEPDLFRRFLTGSHSQIVAWPEAPEYAAMRNAVVNIATTYKTLVLGLSIQDSNLQTLFTRANIAHAWPWPCVPAAPGHVFCEELEDLQRGQRDILRLIYREAYNVDPVGLQEACLIRAWGEKVLIALVLKLLANKLDLLMRYALTSLEKLPIAEALTPLLVGLRNDISGLAVPAPDERNLTAFVNMAIAVWSRVLAIFRNGTLPNNPEAYEVLTSSTPHLIINDQNSLAMRLGFLGVALSLFQHGREKGLWTLNLPVSNDLEAGVMTARALRAGGVDRPVFIVKSATEAIALKSDGAFGSENVIVVHADDAWHQLGGSARRVRGAPGRVGRVDETHISLSNLLTRCDTCEALKKDFVEEVMI